MSVLRRPRCDQRPSGAGWPDPRHSQRQSSVRPVREGQREVPARSHPRIRHGQAIGPTRSTHRHSPPRHRPSSPGDGNRGAHVRPALCPNSIGLWDREAVTTSSCSRNCLWQFGTMGTALFPQWCECHGTPVQTQIAESGASWLGHEGYPFAPPVGERPSWRSVGIELGDKQYGVTEGDMGVDRSKSSR